VGNGFSCTVDEMKLFKLTNKALSAVVLVLLAAVFSQAQSKSYADAAAEIRTFDDFTAFALSYDEARYVTIAEMKVEILGEKDDLRKTLKTFEWQMRSLFALKGIDAKPVQTLLCINSQSKTFLFSRENELTIFFHNEDVGFGVPNRSSELKGKKAGETLCWEINREIVEDLAKADKIEFQVGSIRTRIRADKLQVFKDYGKLLKVAEK
jgi:hypothetical protein